MKRVFLALPASDDPLLTGHYEEIRSSLAAEKIRWVQPGNLHMTLHFFGEMPEEEVTKTDILFRDRLSGLAAFTMELRGVGVFPGIRKPRVLWLGVTAVPGLQDLVTAVEEALIAGDYELPDKPFSAHITLGRIKWIDDRRALTGLLEAAHERIFARIPVNEVHLMESILRPEGPEYRTLSRYVLVE